ncbi:alpha/beta fold hydrolase [Chitinimonas sp.]|uniref:alpha/beta fold hydrolase n=1 Tax=Chitinimonas sp. TaxID=1934313 RepID=UPI0035B4BBBF
MNTRTLLSTAIGATALFAGFAHAAEPARAETTSVVIVHGAFADGSDWAKVIPLLQAAGVKVTAVQNSLESLAGDVATTRRVIASQTGRVVLVGHSWGGMVITDAGVDDKVKGLVYVAAFAPDAGQSVEELGNQYPKPEGLKHLVPDQGGYLYLSPEGMSKYFAQDLSAKQTAIMAATQGPIQAKAFGDKVSNAAWSSRPSWYIVAEKDLMIQPEQERALAKKIGAKVTSLPTSHVPQQSRPADVAKVILDAVQTVAKQ